MSPSPFRITLFVAALAFTTPFAAHAQAKFLDAAQIKPILTATKNNWIAVREFNGRDLLYFSHLLAWRCGLTRVQYALNDANVVQDWDIGTCDEQAQNPNAIADDQKIYLSAPLKSITSVKIFLTYDDNTTDEARFERKSIQIP